MKQLEKEALKEVKRINEIMNSLDIVDHKKSDSLLKVMKSYYTDAKTFYKNEQFLQALEAAFIVWAYADAGLHLKVFEVPEKLKGIFTV